MMTRTSSLDKLEQMRCVIEEVRQFVVESAEAGRPIHDVERGVFDRLLRVGRQALQAFVAWQGVGDLGPTISGPDGENWRRLESTRTRTYRSIFGDLPIARKAYGTRDGQKIEFVPLDQRLSLPESDYSYLLQDWAQSLGVEESFGKVRQFLGRILHLDVPVDSLERMNRHVARHVEAFRASRPAPPADEEGPILVATADNKGVPMRRPADQAPVGARRRKGQKANKKQMATVGCVYTVDPKPRTPEQVVAALFRDPPPQAPDAHRQAAGELAPAEQRPEPKARHKRISSSLSLNGVRGQDEVFAWMAGEMRGRLAGVRETVCLMDGQASLWSDRERYLGPIAAKASQAGAEGMVDVLDLLHATSRVWDAAHLFHPEGSVEASDFARDRILRILRGEVGYVIGGLRQMATKRRLRGRRLERLKTLCGYFEKNRDRMRYDEYLAKGYPIASGVIEGACRYVVKDRMERAGMRWTPEGARAMLDLRTTYVNDQWEDYQAWRIDQEARRLYPYADLTRPASWPLAA